MSLRALLSGATTQFAATLWTSLQLPHLPTQLNSQTPLSVLHSSPWAHGHWTSSPQVTNGPHSGVPASPHSLGVHSQCPCTQTSSPEQPQLLKEPQPSGFPGPDEPQARPPSPAPVPVPGDSP